MAQIAKTTAAKTSGTVQDTTDDVAELRRRTADQAAAAARRGAEVAERSAEDTTKLGRTFVELANEQTRDNLETLKALAGVVDWNRMFQIQGAYLRASLARTTRLTQRYLQAGRPAMTPAAFATWRRADKAA